MLNSVPSVVKKQSRLFPQNAPPQKKTKAFGPGLLSILKDFVFISGSKSQRK